MPEDEQKKSTHKVEVVKIEHIEPCPNADKLDLVKVWGYQCLVRKGDFKLGDLGAYIVPDSNVSAARPEFSFLLDKNHPDKTDIRIRVKKLRGIVSQGLLIKAPEGSKEGDDVAEMLGVTRWEPKVTLTMGHKNSVPGPATIMAPKYDVEDWHRYREFFVPGEEVVGSEKLHGTSSRFVFDGEKLHVGSHNQWCAEDPLNLWWKATLVYKGIVEFCVAHPNIVLYGELYGDIQNLKYGVKQGEFRLAVFDLYDGVKGAFLAHDEARKLTDGFCLDWVPVLFRGPYNEAAMKALSNGPSVMPGANHIREGVVVKPVTERWEKAIGRVQLKIVSDTYLEKFK